ncbi:glycosyltransferase family 4 protein [Rubrobacter naiadicus]|uniref:glycosyltransferase family 4 protein n=1 Tax=Rubrobacter naiadicus TaxID=1392641 RepID=UPI00236142C9|nr:glycosyltransferase family 4 protein [Rubrobacter naiadicus]
MTGWSMNFRLIGPLVSSEVLEGLPDNCRYDGISLPGGVAEAMRRSDIFVLPTLEDAYSLVVLEAMASGLPVVTTTNSGAGEITEDGRDGLIVPAGDASVLAGAIHRMVEEPELRFGLGDAARYKVEESYSWETYGEKVLSAIGGLDARVA